ncbi:hypothetical protein CTI12_AA211730 [Artemisia annua]|uniref:Uncharacterized protein n=1 Tax=Artemisia annua TaxID=35608 RepID=A0A2U1MLZ0_ARTAN|nr:hypothetical protein CTI12_AA211730 [Artemisia annua]
MNQLLEWKKHIRLKRYMRMVSQVLTNIFMKPWRGYRLLTWICWEVFVEATEFFAASSSLGEMSSKTINFLEWTFSLYFFIFIFILS